MNIALQSISKSYGRSVALNNCDLVVRNGAFNAIIGPNGSGKSTLLRIASLLEEPDAGQIVYRDTDSDIQKDTSLRRRIAVVLPGDSLFNDSVFNNVSYGLRIRGMRREFIQDKVHEILDKVALLDRSRKNVRTLSSGEAQRVAVARALVIDPQCLFLDEPTASLDPGNTEIIEDALREVNKNRNITVIMITHNMFQAKRLASRIVFMYRGVVIEDTSVDKFFANPENELTRTFITGKMVW